jgi:uncharacterized membrane protein YcaP (DUF421 family)
MAAFDVVLGMILASVLARAVNGSAALMPTFLAGGVLVFLHRLLSWAAYRSDLVGRIIKGEPERLVTAGVTDERRMRAHFVSEKDLLGEARLNGNVSDLSEIESATMERSGDVSIVPRRKATNP